METDKPTFGNAENIVAGVRYLKERYTGAGNWLRYNGRPVVMFWRPDALPTDGGSLVDAWRAVRDAADPNGELAWVMEGLSWDLLDVFDGQFGYSLAWSPNPANTTASWASRVRAKGKLFIATVMPGYDDTRVRPAPEGFSRDRGDGAFLASTWQAAIRAGAEWVNVTSFNEWIEGSQIEPSAAYGDLYLRLNREWSDRFKGR